MTDRTCQFCERRFSGRKRRFCYGCLPQHANAGTTYSAAYNRLYQSAVLGQWFPSSQIPQTHPAWQPHPPRCHDCGAPARTRPGADRCDGCYDQMVERQTAAREAKRQSKQRIRARQRGGQLGGLADPRECQWCFAEYRPEPKLIHRRFCSSDCYQTARSHSRLTGAIDRSHIPICMECRNPTGLPPQRYGFPICTPCNDREKDSAERSRKVWRRGAVQAGDAISIAELCERDGWRCHLCKHRIPKTAKHPDPKSPSVDHLIPISAGGPHEWANVALAHLRCNVKRSAGGTAQLRLA